MEFSGVGVITVAVAVIIGIVSMSRRSEFVLLAGLLAAATLAVPAVGAESTTSHDVPTFVTPPQRPTEVAIGAYLIGLSQVSEPSAAFPTVEVEVFLQLEWKDPRLAFESDSFEEHSFQEEEAEEKLSEIWSPDLEIQNEVEQRQSESVQLTIHRDGSVAYEERFGATLNAEIDLRRFPFDDQIFELEFQSFLWDNGDSVLVANPKEIGFDADFETPEWWVSSVDAMVSQSTEVRDDTAFSTYTFRVHASRRAGHYVLRFMLPLAFVMGLTWCAFWMPVDARPRVGFIALLTVVASHTVITGDLPRLHYPTFADILLFVCYVFATTLIVVSIIVQRIDDGGAPERARSIESRTRWLLPLVTAISLGGFALVLWS